MELYISFQRTQQPHEAETVSLVVFSEQLHHENHWNCWIHSFTGSSPRGPRPRYYRSVAQRAVLVVAGEPLVQAVRVESVRAVKAPNLRIFGEIVKTDSAVPWSTKLPNRDSLVDILTTADRMLAVGQGTSPFDLQANHRSAET
jgi:hypothetical protein